MLLNNLGKFTGKVRIVSTRRAPSVSSKTVFIYLAINLVVVWWAILGACAEKNSSHRANLTYQKKQRTALASSAKPEHRQTPGGDAKLVKPWARIKLEEYAKGFFQLTYLTHAGDGSQRVFIVEKPGLIKVASGGRVQPEPFLDIRSRVRSQESERGLLGLAFHPDFRKNGRFYVDYTNLDGNTVISEFKVTSDPNKADPASERILLTIQQPAANHNGGQILFGPDGYLYIGMGDGGAAGDPWGNAQNKGVLLGKILRIDVDGGAPYGVPKDNPFVNQASARPEIWAYGLRNPWRFSFDRLTGDLYIADVGQNKWEEIDFVPSGSAGGLNFGWDLMEGSHPFELKNDTDVQNLVSPVVEYGHNLGCSVTGGYVYRGNRYPELQGTYFFSDYCSGTIWGLRMREGNWEWAKFLDPKLRVSSFGEDESGEVYILDYFDGYIYHLAAE